MKNEDLLWEFICDVTEATLTKLVVTDPVAYAAVDLRRKHLLGETVTKKEWRTTWDVATRAAWIEVYKATGNTKRLKAANIVGYAAWGNKTVSGTVRAVARKVIKDIMESEVFTFDELNQLLVSVAMKRF